MVGPSQLGLGLLVWLLAVRSAKALQEVTVIQKKLSESASLVITFHLSAQPSSICEMALAVPCRGEGRRAATREGLCPVAWSHSAGPWYPVCVGN